MVEWNGASVLRKPCISPDEHVLRNLPHMIRRHMSLHNLAHMVLMPGDQFAEPIDITAQNLIDTFGIIGQECLRSCKADRPPCLQHGPQHHTPSALRTAGVALLLC